MIRMRRSEDRGFADHGWLKARHTFSFAEYHDPQQMGFRSLRVINEDRVAPSMGFGTHGHREMEIVTYIYEGALRHEDSMGNGSVLRAGDVQRMSAGTGIRHSEMNPSADEAVRLLQIWLLPGEANLEPGWEERSFPVEQKRGVLRPIVTPSRREGSLAIHQDVEIFATVLDPGQSVEHALAPGRHAWLQVIRGTPSLNGETMGPGDGAAISDEARLKIDAGVSGDPVEAILFDLS